MGAKSKFAACGCDINSLIELVQKLGQVKQAEIFRAELEQRLIDLEQAQKELREVQHGRELS
jgi:hypothetical protein